jgi:hypothetical protein
MVLKDTADTTHCVKPLSALDFRGYHLSLPHDAASGSTDVRIENS